MSQSETWRQHPATAEELAGAVLGLVERSDTVTFGELAKWMGAPLNNSTTTIQMGLCYHFARNAISPSGTATSAHRAT